MTVTINIHGENAEQALHELRGLSVGLLGEPKPLFVKSDEPPPRTVAPAEETKADEPAPKKTRAKKEVAPSISTTPEDRKPPEDDAETQEQDAADEAAEVEAARPAAAPLTVEDVMGAVGGYVEKFGLPAAQEDGPNIFVSALGKPPGGEPYWKKSLLATATQDQLQKALVAWKTAAAAGQRFVAKGA